MYYPAGDTHAQIQMTPDLGRPEIDIDGTQGSAAIDGRRWASPYLTRVRLPAVGIKPPSSTATVPALPGPRLAGMSLRRLITPNTVTLDNPLVASI